MMVLVNGDLLFVLLLLLVFVLLLLFAFCG